MKKFMKSLVLVAVAAMGFASCSNNFEDVTTSTETFLLTIESEKPALESDSRTEFNDGSIIWTENDQIRACYYHSTGVWSKYYASTENNVTDGGAKATFTGINTNSGGFPAISGEGTYTFYAGYPKTAISGSQQTDAPTNGELSVVVPTEQTMPKLGTFDADADVMVGVSPEVVDAPATTISVAWTRLVAHGCVTLKNLAAEAGEKVLSVTFTAPEGVNLTGTGKVNFTAQTMTALNNNTVTVALPTGTEAKVAELPVWFCSAPATIASGANFTISVVTARGTYTRTITAKGNGINFMQNRYNTLGVDMALAEFTPTAVSSDVWAKVNSLDEITDGTYVITANDFYCPNNVTQKPQAYTLTSANVSVDGDKLSGNVPDKMKWTFTGTASGMVITKFAGSEQLYATNTNNGVKVGSSDGKTWIASGSNGEFMLVYQLDEPRCLTLYNLADWRCYKTSAAAQSEQVRTLTLYKLQDSDAPVVPSLSLAQTEIEVEAAAGTATVGVNHANLTEDITVTPEENSFITSATISGNTLSFDYEENDDTEERTAYIVVASGDLSVTLNITQKGIAGGDDEEEGVQIVTIAQFIEKEESSTVWYQLTGTIASIANTTYGNFNLTDETGTIFVYGLTATKVDTNDRSFSSLGLNVGDQVTIEGLRSSYSSTAQVGSSSTAPAYLISSVKYIQRNLSFDKTMVTLNLGDAFEQPTLTGTKTDDVTYESDNTAVATVNATTGAVVINGVGTAKITASAPKTNTHAAGSASYTITVNEAGSTVVAGGRDDFNTVDKVSSYGTRTTTAGWKGTNCAVAAGGNEDSSSSATFKSLLGTDTSVRAFIINGKTSAKGTITSPTLSTGCGKLELKYGNPYSESNAPKFKVEIKQNGTAVKTFTVSGGVKTQNTVQNWSADVNVAGDFQIVITNLSPTNSSQNKDRTAIWDVIWTGYKN